MIRITSSSSHCQAGHFEQARACITNEQAFDNNHSSTLLLAYTGARYAHLQQWQTASTSCNAIVGGVKHRAMSSLYNEVRLELDVDQS